MARLIAALSLTAAALFAACGRSEPPNSPFDTAGYHVRGQQVCYLNAFGGKAFEIAGADAASFQSLDTTYGRDRSTVYVNGRRLTGADSSSFALLNRPGFAEDAHHVYQLDRPISDDPGHFELLDGGLSKDSVAVYASDGRVLSADPAHFAIVGECSADQVHAYYRQSVIAGADPRSFPPGRAVTGCTEASVALAP